MIFYDIVYILCNIIRFVYIYKIFIEIFYWKLY